MQVDTSVFEQLRELLSEITVTSREEIFPDSDLEEDLGLNLAEDVVRLLAKVNRHFDIEIDKRMLLEELEEAGASVLELTKLIHEELELG